jgi:hypothetical protein
VFSIILALTFSLAVCAVIGVGATTLFNRAVEFFQKQRDRISVKR